MSSMSSSLVKSKSTSTVGINRKSLVQLASETPLRDPSAFARQRVTSLDNNARITNEKKRQYIKQIEKEREELLHIDKQISNLTKKYTDLCSSLADKKESRDRLLSFLQSSTETKNNIMNQTKFTVGERMHDESKLLRWMARNQVEMERGYSTVKLNGTSPCSHHSKNSRMAATSGKSDLVKFQKGTNPVMNRTT